MNQPIRVIQYPPQVKKNILEHDQTLKRRGPMLSSRGAIVPKAISQLLVIVVGATTTTRISAATPLLVVVFPMMAALVLAVLGE
jgi:hypothetical protein